MSNLENLFAGQNFDKEGDDFPNETGPMTDSKLTEARLCAQQAIFQSMVSDEQTLQEVMDEFLLHRLKERKADKKIFKLIVSDVKENLERYEEMLKGHITDTWDYERVGLVEKTLMIAAVSELSCNPKAPTKVVLNEYLDISKGFLAPDGTKFLNGVLHTLSGKIRDV